MASILSALFNLKMLKLQPPWISVTSVIIFKSSFHSALQKEKEKRHGETLYAKEATSDRGN